MSSSGPRKKRGLTVFLSIVLILLLLVLGSLLWYKTSLSAPGSEDQTAEIEVSEGETYQTLLDSLKEQGLIKSSLASSLYARLHGNSDVYAGTFELNKGMTAPEVMQYLGDPSNIKQSYAVVTIPEGWWAKQIAAELAKQFPDYSAQDFLDLWNDDDYINTLAKDYAFIDPALVEDDQYFVKLEGYLYPETYYLEYDMTPDQITRTLLDQFNSWYTAHLAEIEQSGKSVQEIVTLASIVQFESGDPSQMPDIARVFYNRLDQGMMLQSSVTVCYALYDDYKDASDCETNTQVDSPYNTYTHEGLPIGPILNPGADALDAVLNPADNDYLYFVADIHGDGSVHYARTYEEHEANIEKYNLKIE